MVHKQNPFHSPYLPYLSYTFFYHILNSYLVPVGQLLLVRCFVWLYTLEQMISTCRVTWRYLWSEECYPRRLSMPSYITTVGPGVSFQPDTSSSRSSPRLCIQGLGDLGFISYVHIHKTLAARVLAAKKLIWIQWEKTPEPDVWTQILLIKVERMWFQF